MRQDPFFTRQPEKKFIEDLKKPLHKEAPKGYGTRSKAEGEICAKGMYLANRFSPDPKGLLETVYTDFARFLQVYGIGGDRYPVRLEWGETPVFEAYRVKITAEGATVTAADTEGIRRGIIFLEDELRRREGAFLEPGEMTRKPHIRSRITRCFFSPINRPPKNEDELNNDIDYYPEEYLNRLMHDGSNGVWIYTRFSDLLPSTYLVENGTGYEKRIAKLCRVVEKCARYGIGVYVFAIEPAALTEEQAKKYPQAAGATIWGTGSAFCMNTDFGKGFCREAGRTLLELVPDLRGFISITNGERSTSCSSAGEACDCPRCSKRSRGQRLSDAVEALCAGFREKNPDFEVVSWTYGHRSWKFDDIREYVETAPADARLMQNFDDMGKEKQLGKERLCADYWLSYVGPSEMFRVTAEATKEFGKHLFAKMQVCCSHEIASVPYIPTPGLIFEKYKGAFELGVEGVLQCWYFGNYPCLMSKAAGELSFLEDFSDKKGFLRSLAAIFWGNSNADRMVEVWNLLEEGYRQYPMNIMFSYYGPMHDSVVWKLALKPKNYSLPRTWQTVDPIDGDRIRECLLTGHTLEEGLELAERMSAAWEQGADLMRKMPDLGEDSREQKSVVEALRLLLRGGRNILRFYWLRDELGWQKGDPAAILREMREIVKEEWQNSAAMLPLWEADGRLGYHSEGEGYKFFPEKLRDRMEQLEELLNTEFPEVEERVQKGLPPLEYYLGVEHNPLVRRYALSENGIDRAKWETFPDGQNSRFRMAREGEDLWMEFQSDGKAEFRICPEFLLLHPQPGVTIRADNTLLLDWSAGTHWQLYGEKREELLKKYDDRRFLEGEGTHLLLRVHLPDFGVTEKRPMKVRVTANGQPWYDVEENVSHLAKYDLRPTEYFWLV